MGIIAPDFITVTPSFIEPNTVVQYSQVSGAFELLPNGVPITKLQSNTLAVYVKRLDLRTQAASGISSYNMLPSVTPVFSYGSTPAYLARMRAEWDHHDEDAGGVWGVGVQNVYRLGGRQGLYQFMRVALLYGINPAFGEGLTNPTNGYSITLPADTNGNQTISTYDNGQAGQFLLSTIAAMKTRTNAIGIGRKFVILAPQRIQQTWEYSIVQLVQYQRAGAGTETTAGIVKLVGAVMEDEIIWVADDTLIGKGSGGTDLIVFCMPEIEVVDAMNQINTNEFYSITPHHDAITAMYCDMVAPREIMAPLAGGATDMVMEHRHTSGWTLRPEGVTLLSAGF